ncbi:hypothetical protein BC777_3457 [Yoonia maricola]|uniref:SHOCT domain-containing protein n=1 Tax=Yoonia maricola TaxID=420999 RepID=A0A2M8W0F1_9RHOB|nr:hypothetical protein [Yoonia maricola]PJI84399.1 hypothetical protein BC777_3457 [Yoonia maricola]
MIDRENEIKRLETLYDDGKITYAEFEKQTRDLILTPNQEIARRDKLRWQQGGGIIGYIRRMTLRLFIWLAFGAVAAGGAYLFLGKDFWAYLVALALAPMIIALLISLKDGF